MSFSCVYIQLFYAERIQKTLSSLERERERETERGQHLIERGAVLRSQGTASPALWAFPSLSCLLGNTARMVLVIFSGAFACYYIIQKQSLRCPDKFNGNSEYQYLGTLGSKQHRNDQSRNLLEEKNNNHSTCIVSLFLEEQPQHTSSQDKCIFGTSQPNRYSC